MTSKAPSFTGSAAYRNRQLYIAPADPVRQAKLGSHCIMTSDTAWHTVSGPTDRMLREIGEGSCLFAKMMRQADGDEGDLL